MLRLVGGTCDWTQELTSLRPNLHSTKIFDLGLFFTLVDYWGNHRNLWQTGLRGDNSSSLSEEQLSNRLGDLQFSKIKRLENFFLSHSESTQICRTYASVDLASVGCSLSLNCQRMFSGAACLQWWQGRRIYRQRSLGAKWLKWPNVSAWHLSTTVGMAVNAQLYLRYKKADSRTWLCFSGRKSYVFASEAIPSAHEISHL